MNTEDILDILAIGLIGIVTDDESIVISTNKGEPVVIDDKSFAGKAYRNIVQRILGEQVDFLNLEQNDESKFSKVLKLIFGK